MKLRIGSKGEKVLALQEKLKELGFNPGPIDGVFKHKTRKAVVRFQASVDLETDGVVGVRTLEALGLKMKVPQPEKTRTQFKELLLLNPNYFGNISGSSYETVEAMSGNVFYEELMCVGYHPEADRLEAVVHVKQEYGYKTSICAGGSTEYVRFYIDWNDDGTWEDVGLAEFTAYDISGDKPLEYAVSILLGAQAKVCLTEHLPKVRAILSWNQEPPPDTPNFPPVWGNVVDVQIQIDEIDVLLLPYLLESAQAELPKKLLKRLDVTQPLAISKAPDLTLM
ncbi:MAG: peptidoglycan-binding domain-containing protein, partial [Candidatus Thorarchaeota archaeon]